MKALCWHGKSDIRCDTVPDPEIKAPRDAIIKVTACAICGSDLHTFNGVIPEMEIGDVIGHETRGEVVEVGAENKNLKVGDRVVVPFTIACGECFFAGMASIPAVSVPIQTERPRRRCGDIPLRAYSAIRTF
jgi:threonine dehydrogenase-like Zn-dependent dehydrogenase